MLGCLLKGHDVGPSGIIVLRLESLGYGASGVVGSDGIGSGDGIVATTRVIEFSKSVTIPRGPPKLLTILPIIVSI